MANQKTFIIGDIHGCLEMLKNLMDKIAWSPDKDRLIFLGDYIDRGENPKGVVDFILDLTRRSSLVECLKGNHEAMLLDFITGRDRFMFIINGGWKTLESYGMYESSEDDSAISSEHRVFYESLKLYVELDDYYVVHAGFKPGLDIKKQTEDEILWIRKSFVSSDFDFGKKIIFGHTPFKEPLIMQNKIGLDTGAVYGNKLTCLQLPEMKFHSVEA